jgi:predicted RNase H-like HicB family nuclease
MNRQFTAVIEREGDGYISFCPEVDVASQGNTVQEASENLREAVELFFESAPKDEISRRLH